MAMPNTPSTAEKIADKALSMKASSETIIAAVDDEKRKIPQKNDIYRRQC